MEIILYVILGVALGFAIVYVWLSGRLSHARQELAVKQSQLEQERENARQKLSDALTHAEEMREAVRRKYTDKPSKSDEQTSTRSKQIKSEYNAVWK